MNKVILMGRLTKDPEVRYSGNEGNMAIASFDLAVDRRFKRPGDEVTADFFNCTAFGKKGEFVEKYLKKGIKVLVEGQMQNNNYTNREGQKVYGFRLIVDELEFAESKQAGDNAHQSAAREPVKSPKQTDSYGWMNIADNVSDETLPFN